MKHTIHTEVVTDIQIDLWGQLNPTNYVEPPTPIPTVLESVIQAAGGRKEPTTDAEETEETEEDGQNNQEEDCEVTNTCTEEEEDIPTNLSAAEDLLGEGNNSETEPENTEEETQPENPEGTETEPENTEEEPEPQPTEEEENPEESNPEENPDENDEEVPQGEAPTRRNLQDEGEDPVVLLSSW